MDAALKAEFAKPGHMRFDAVQIDLEGDAPQTIRLLSGGFVSFSVDGVSQTFRGSSPAFGTLGAIDVIKEGLDESPTRAEITLLPPGSMGLGALTDAKAQMSRIRIWNGAIDQTTGLSVGAPELVFDGLLDFARLKIDETSWRVILECMTEEELQLLSDEQKRLNNAFHQSVWPGELGCAYVSDVTRKVFWRMASPRTSVTYYGGGGGSGGSNGGFIRNLF